MIYLGLISFTRPPVFTQLSKYGGVVEEIVGGEILVSEAKEASSFDERLGIYLTLFQLDGAGLVSPDIHLIVEESPGTIIERKEALMAYVEGMVAKVKGDPTALYITEEGGWLAIQSPDLSGFDAMFEKVTHSGRVTEH